MIVSDGDVGDNAKYFLALRDVPGYPGIGKAFTVSPEEAQGRVPVVIKAKDVNVLDYDVDDPTRRELEFEVVATVASEVVSSLLYIISVTIFAIEHSFTSPNCVEFLMK